MEVPVITTHATGCCDSIQEGVTGLFVKHDVAQLSDAILRISNASSGVDGKKAREWVRANFENHIVWNEIEKLY